MGNGLQGSPWAVRADIKTKHQRRGVIFIQIFSAHLLSPPKESFQATQIEQTAAVTLPAGTLAVI